MLPRTLGIMLLCAGIGYLVGRSRGMGIQGFFFGLAFGPLGWGLILLWPRTWVQGPAPRPESGPRRESRVPGGCPRCGGPVEPGAGACGHCGNVLLPIHYAVDPDK